MKQIPLCSFWSKEKLIQRCQEIGERAFARGFRQKAISSEELTFPHFGDCLRIGESMPMWQHAFTGVDLSSDTRPGNIIITVGLDAAGIKYPIDIRIGAWSSPETASQIKDVWERYKSPVIHVENNAYQTSLLEWMRTKDFSNIPIQGFTTGKQKSDSEIGLPSLDVQFERKQWRFYVPDHNIGCNCAWCRLVKEFKSHPGFSTSDCVMAFWFAERALTKYGMGHVIREQKPSPGITKGVRGMQW